MKPLLSSHSKYYIKHNYLYLYSPNKLGKDKIEIYSIVDDNVYFNPTFKELENILTSKDNDANLFKFQHNNITYIIKVSDIITINNNWKNTSKIPRKYFKNLSTILNIEINNNSKLNSFSYTISSDSSMSDDIVYENDIPPNFHIIDDVIYIH